LAGKSGSQQKHVKPKQDFKLRVAASRNACLIELKFFSPLIAKAELFIFAKELFIL